MTPYSWQSQVLEAWLGTDKRGLFTAARCALAVPRQNGKNAVLEMVELYKMVVLGRKILHSAHQVRTSALAFHRLASFFENPRQHPELAALTATVRRGNGKEAILLRNGGSVEFIARSRTAGRGFSVDDLVMDEAQILSEDALAAVLPVLSAAPSGNPQMFLTGTPPGPDDDGAVFHRQRDLAMDGVDERLAWLEWSVAGPVDLDDRTVWEAANPGLAVGRVLASVVSDERASMDPERFARERLGVWGSEVVRSVIEPDAWAACATSSPPTSGPKAFGVDMSPDRRMAAIGAARLDEATGRVHVEVAVHEETAHGAGWIVDWLADPVRRSTPRAVVIDAMSPAAALVTSLQDAGVVVTMTGPGDMARACGSFYDAVGAGMLTHFDQVGLNRAVAAARRRAIGAEGGWGWNRKAGGDITPLVAVTLAAHGLVSRKARKPRTGAAVFA